MKSNLVNGKKIIGEAVLKEQPQLYFGNPPLTIGDTYKVFDKEGSNLWIVADDNSEVSIGACRFIDIKFH